MVLNPPPIDPRAPTEIAEQTRRLLVHYLSSYGWTSNSDGGEAGRVLVGVFAHYCGLVIDRINRAPEKHFLAFLDLLGNSLTPPRPAAVPLTFFFDGSATGGLAVPAGTRVQAEATAANGEPLLFETERDLWLSNFDFAAMVKVGPGAGERRDLGERIVRSQTATLKPLHASEGFAVGETLFDQHHTLYLGLDITSARQIERQRPVSLYFFIGAVEYDSTASASASGAEPRLVWEYQGGTAPRWLPLLVDDDTDGLTRSGSLDFLAPEDFTKAERPASQGVLYWIRASLRDMAAPNPTDTDNVSTAVYSSAPRLRAIALNTVGARQAITVRDEVLGSSSGTPGQTFKSFYRPILDGERLEVRERPAAGRTGLTTDSEAAWTAWQQVPDFYGSGAQNRHYVVDRERGEIRFGDGQQGMIPPPGVRNVRLAVYPTGGGSVGNVSADTVNTLVAGGRFIEKVTNVIAASGGADVETEQALLERAPRALRHRGRAVTEEDHEDLARLASTAVARALCVPLIDLARDPVKVISTLADEAASAGHVSVIIVPRSADPRPLPSLALLRQVKEYLGRHGSATAVVSVVGPIYLRVDVEVKVRLASLRLQDRVERDLRRALAAYLHPLTGRDGGGWQFGREPHESDIYRLIGSIEGIDHIASLTLDATADVPAAGWAANLAVADRTDKVRKTGRFLIYHSGPRRVIFY